MIRSLLLAACVLFFTSSLTHAQTKTPAYKPAATAAEAIKRIEELGGQVASVSLKDGSLDVDLRATAISNNHLKYLSALKMVAVVRLGETTVTDAGLSHLGKIATLKRLYLERTAITDAGLRQLASLRDLEFLNLFGTKITDAGLQHLGSLPKLKTVVVTETKVTPGGINGLKKAIAGIGVVPDPALELAQAEAAWKVARAACQQAEKDLALAVKESKELDGQAPQLKKLLDKLNTQSKKLRMQADQLRKQAEDADRQAKKRKTPEAKQQAANAQKAYDQARVAQEVEQTKARETQQLFQKASNAKRNAEYARKRLQSCQQIEDDARLNLERLQTMLSKANK